uniref:Uncharacterized protein n=1 Tax=Neogobius melanostomus TaxID=47308 RepID=A0A8C6UUM7_9GOBI
MENLDVPLLSEDLLLCPICLEVFAEPVSTPCGHNFCMSCLSSYWDSSAPVCFCPVCKENFSNRPQLRVNTFIRRLVPGLRRHTLIPPVTSLQDRVCPQHHQLLHSYCTEEGALLCVGCEGAHSKHRTLSLEKAYKKLRDQLEPNEDKITCLIQEKVQKIWSIRDTKAQRHEETRRVITQSEKVLQDVLKKVQKSHKDLVQKMEEKQQQADSEAEALVVQTEDEVEELLETHTKLQELKQTEDPLMFLQKHPNMSITFQSKMRGTLKICTTRIKKTLQKLNNEISLFSDEKWWALRSLQRHTVDIKLDPETAHPNLRLSPDLKQVSFTRNVTVPANNKRGSYRALMLWQTEVSPLGKFPKGQGVASGHCIFESISLTSSFVSH